MDFLNLILHGGRGPGAYYIMLFFQLLFIFPFIKYAFDKQPYITAIVCIVMQVIWEYLCIYNSISSFAYNVLIFSYLSNIVAGFIAWTYFKKISKTDLPLVFVCIGGYTY